MSESSKMGLFGSKDKNKEQKKEQSKKEDSPDRYTPYCIDSDSETYDTEALSMMDINDIIGVQSDPVSDSTLESEIAALSQIITDSKAENNQTNIKSQSQSEDIVDNLSVTSNKGEKVDNKNIVREKKEQVTVESVNICDTDTCSSNNIMLQSQCNIQKSMSENSELDSCIDTNTNSKTDSYPAFLNNICEVSSKEVHEEHGTSPHKEVHVTHNADSTLPGSNVNEILSQTILAEESSAVSKVHEQLSTDRTKNYNIKHDVDTLVSMEGISQSLQLIGEAYISEDSQETNSTETDSRKEELLVSFTDISPIHCAKEENSSSIQHNERQITDSSDIMCKDLISVKELEDPSQHKKLSEDSNIVEETLDIDSHEHIEPSSEHNEKEQVESKDKDTNLMVEEPNIDQLHNIKDTNSELSVVGEMLQKVQSVFNTKEDTQHSSEHKDSLENMCVVDMVSSEKVQAEEKSEISKNIEEEIESNVLLTNNKLEEDTHSKSDNGCIDTQTLQNESVAESKHLEDHDDNKIHSNETVDHFIKPNENWNTSEAENVNFTDTVALTTSENTCVDTTESVKSVETIQSHTNKLVIKEPNNEECLPESCINVNLNDSEGISINSNIFDSTSTLETENVLTSPIISENHSCNDIDPNCIENSIESGLNSLNNITSSSFEEIEKLNIEPHAQVDAVTDTPMQDNKPLIPMDIAESVSSTLDVSEFQLKSDSILSDDAEINETCVSKIEKINTNENIVISDKSTEPIQIEVKESDIQSEITSDESKCDTLLISQLNENKIDALQETNTVEENDKNDMDTKRNLLDLPTECTNEAPLIESNDKENNSEQCIRTETEIHVINKINEEITDIQKTCAFVEDMDKNADSQKLLNNSEISSFSLEENKVAKDTLIQEKTTEKCNTEAIPCIDVIVTGDISNNNEDTIDKKEDLSNVTDNVNDKSQKDKADKILNKEMDLITDIEKTNLSVEECATTTEEKIEKQDITKIIQESNTQVKMDLSSPFKSTSTDLQNILQNDKKNENLGILVCTNDETMPILPDNSDETISILPDNLDETMPILPDNSDETIPILPDNSDETMPILPDNSDETMPILPDNLDETMPILPDNSDETISILPDNLDETMPILPDNSDETIPILSDNSEDTIPILPDNSDETMPILPDNSDALMEKADVEDSLNNSISENNLINILEDTAKITDMFSEEQSQNTQDIMKSILDNVTDFKNILSSENNTKNETEDNIQQSVELSMVENEDKELVQKLSEDSDMLNKEIDDPIVAPNLDSLEQLLDLDLIPESDETAVKDEKIEEVQEQVENIDKNVDMTLFLQQPEEVSPIPQNSDFIGNVINNCLTDRNDESLEDTTGEINTDTHNQDKIEINTEHKSRDLLEINDNIIATSLDKNTDNVDLQKQFDVSNTLQNNDLDIGFVGNSLESIENLEEGTSKLEISQDILLEDTNQDERLHETTINMDTSQTTPDISELESAVKFLQESEEQTVDSPLVLSPKIVESVVNDISKQTGSTIFVQDEDICDDASELVVELQGITSDSISISEAEIISEAAKLENERKLAEQIKAKTSISHGEENDVKKDEEEKKNNIPLTVTTYFETTVEKVCNKQTLYDSNTLDTSPVSSKIADRKIVIGESIPKISILEERLKEPPKIEIPAADITKMCESLTGTKDSLLIPKDAKMSVYQKMLESPKSIDNKEIKIVDTPKKEIERHDFENVGSPRIILKIAKSAIAECGEPRSPKSPKIRSATNSPNPEDSPGQKLGKIKLKLSKSGHPSIISNENIEDISQWHTDSTASLSPIGMKIKLSKTGDALIVPSEKHESVDDLKEIKHKFEEAKRTESPLGMKIKLSKTGDASIVQQDSKDIATKYKEKLDVIQGSPKRTDSPIGMKIKLLKTGDASIIQPEKQEVCEDYKDGKLKEKVEVISDPPKRTESPIGMKLKLSKSGDVSIVSPDAIDEGKDVVTKSKERLDSSPEIPKRTDSPIGMKIKLSKTKGGASIISIDNPEEMKEKLDISDIPKRTESPFGMKIKLSKSGDASIIHSEISDEIKEIKQKEKIDMSPDTTKYTESSCGMKIKMIKYGETSVGIPEVIDRHPSSHDVSQKLESIGMKIKFSKFGDASIVPPDKQGQVDEHKCKEMSQDLPKRTESPIGMKIKLSKTGDASIIQNEILDNNTNKIIDKSDMEYQKNYDTSLSSKVKIPKVSDTPVMADLEKKEKQQKRKDTESPLEMKIKLSKTGHPTIVPCEAHGDSTHKSKESTETSHNFAHRYKESILHKDSPLKILKTGHSTFMQGTHSELTIEPIQMQGKKMENAMELSSKRKEITISPIEVKKSKLEAQLSQILPEVTIQPVMSRDQKQLLFDPKTSLISRQQMNVISQEISITQVRPAKQDVSMSDKLKDMLCKNVSSSSIGSDCEIIEHRPELIIVNENSNSSQDVMIIEEVSPIRMPEVKMPKKRGRPRRNPLPPQLAQASTQLLIPRDPLALDEMPQVVELEHKESERPRRTCRNQKSYAPPKRGRGRGRGKRKLDNLDLSLNKKPRVEQDLNAIESSTMAIITLDEAPKQQQTLRKSSELYKALKQSPIDVKNSNVNTQLESATVSGIEDERSVIPEKEQTTTEKTLSDKIVEKTAEAARSTGHENKEMLIPPGHPNWLTPTSKRPVETTPKNETVPSLQVIDEETRMSAESNSRSQTPARNISTQASETIVNEESQGSVLSTATTESEKVKVKNRRMEINFDPDEGPFTVDKIAEYEWPLDRKGETFMIQEQISQYLGVKSFKRKYPDLKRRMVDMEERNYLRENGLVSEAMCDMGLTAVCSSEVLDVMCSDFPDQYEEYRKHMREKQVKEHSKKQKELTAAANAERNRIDLAEMAVQSALTWNISLNKSRKENRKCSLDLQTFTIHVPKKQHKLETDRKISHYPVALIPGQYTDYYREYTPAELRYYPLNTVLYGPMRPNERKFDSQSEGSQSDSDSDTSTDDSSSTSSEGTQDTEGSQSTMDDVDMEINNQKEETKLKCKMCLKTLNKHGKNEVLIQCGTCNGNVHPSCIEITLDMVPHIQSYAWQCTDCKTCAQCHDPADEDKMLFCDMCDRGYHIYCVGLRRVPMGRWHCQECAVCANCGSREPGGATSDRNSVAQWQHEYKKGDKNTRVYVSTLCVPCSKLRGDQRTGI
ncbi:hypothetical protein KPH14_009358 [Odynerus spinipes]|uniref:PHD-type domain-containing protein n=1 Tax=Odynerus spinipes TaxID=1348599 RepID=A0AAD9RP51_9HYME|nr:hypothetical protein KPH14_009358 [Odynerus spinipes]